MCINIENTQYLRFLVQKVQKPIKMLNTHLPRGKNFTLMNLTVYAQSGSLNKQTKNPTKLRNYRQLKTIIDVVQKFDKILAKIYYINPHTAFP